MAYICIVESNLKQNNIMQVEITEQQAQGIEYSINWLCANSMEKIAHADKELSKDYEWAYRGKQADEKLKQVIIQKMCATLIHKIAIDKMPVVQVVADFLNNLFKDYFAWYPSNSGSVPENRHAELKREALAAIIERIGNICPLIQSGVTLKPLFK